MATHRRKEYSPMRLHPEAATYHKLLDKYRAESYIINPKVTPDISAIIVHDKHSAETKLYELLGDENGVYTYNHEQNYKEVKAIIPEIKEEIQKIENQFKQLNQQRWNMGMEPLKKMPEDLQEKKYKLEALLDMHLEEVDKVQEFLNEILAQEKAIEDAKVLQYGLQGAYHFHGFNAKDPALVDVISEIDGQTVGQIGNMLVILDERSPYNGMSVIDYRKLVSIEQKKQGEETRRLWDAREKELKEKGFSNIKIPNRVGRKVPRETLPPWPDWAKNYLKEQQKAQARIAPKKPVRLRRTRRTQSSER